MNDLRDAQFPPLVFVHGSGDRGRIWRAQLDHFGTQQAYAIDLPGHGQRRDTLPADVSVQDYASSVQHIISQELSLHKPIIVGHSLGGAIALMMALTSPDKLSGIVLIGTGARLRILPTLLEAAKQAPEQAQQQLSSMAITQSTPTITRKTIEQDQKPHKLQGANMLYRDLAACNTFDIMSRLYEISLPTLIVCGADDQLTPVKYSTYLHAHLRGSTIHIIAGAGHYVMREQPQMVNETLARWRQLTFSPSTD